MIFVFTNNSETRATENNKQKVAAKPGQQKQNTQQQTNGETNTAESMHKRNNSEAITTQKNRITVTAKSVQGNNAVET